MESEIQKVSKENMDQTIGAVRCVFEGNMESAINRMALFKSLISTANLSAVFEEKQECYLRKLTAALYGILDDVERGYLESMEKIEKMMQQNKTVAENEEIGQ